MSYQETHRRSLAEPEAFWAEMADAIDWERRWDRVLDDSRPPFYRWFAGARLNTCWNALTHSCHGSAAERWVPAFAGTTNKKSGMSAAFPR